MADLQTQETGKDTWEHDIPRLQARGKNGRTGSWRGMNERTFVRKIALLTDKLLPFKIF